MNNPAYRQTLVLVGYRGTGKSTVGRILADRLGLPFADADDELEALAGAMIPQIFASRGEAAFRDWESEVLGRLAGRGEGIVATGGGVVLRESNRGLLRSMGFVVWLSAPSDVISGRLRSDPRGLASRPALTTSGTLDEVARVLEARTPLYREVAHAVVETGGKTPAQAADAILDLWQPS